MPIGTESSSHAWDLPATFDVNGAGWLVVTESNLSGSFHGSRLGGSPAEGEYSVVGPHEDEGDGVGSALSTSDLPWTTPWRAFAIVDRATDLLAGDLVLNLADPSRLEDTSWVSPGRVSWSWWSENDSPRDLARLRAYVDLAADFGWEYSLVDANWTDHTESEMRELVRYASSRGVGTLLWYNSGGPHNHVTLEPRDRMHDATVRRAEFAKIKSWGVAGVKVDFFHSDKQDGIARYLDILEDAAEAKLMVNFHGCTIPRGWSRTWPHLMTMEAVRGAETYIPDHDFERDAPSHNTILPFTRNVAGPMDYTPVTFSDTHRVHLTTMAHELALSVVFESGLLHLSDSVESYRAVPAQVADVLKAVPAAWDETRGVSGEPGDHVVVARRLGEQWFVAGISGQSSASTVELDLLRLGGGGRQWRLLRDGDGRDDVLPEDLAPDEAPVRVKMAAHGGFLAHTLD